MLGTVVAKQAAPNPVEGCPRSEARYILHGDPNRFETDPSTFCLRIPMQPIIDPFCYDWDSCRDKRP